MKRFLFSALALAVFIPAAFSAYTYYVQFTSPSGITPSQWSGALCSSYNSSGFYYTSGGVCRSTVSVPDSSADYEVKITLTAAGFGRAYLRSSSDTNWYYALDEWGNEVLTDTGTFYAVDFTGTNVTVYKRVSGNLYYLGAANVPFSATMRASIVGSTIRVTVDSAFANVLTITDTSITSGLPGFGTAQTYSPTLYAVALGPADRTAPPALNPQNVGTSSFPNRVDMQWTGAVDDANGSGIDSVIIYRNGGYFYTQSANASTFTDATTSPSTNYTYQIIWTDHHGNSNIASAPVINITTPPANSVDPRRVGIKPLGAYYGALGEQIDLLSSNLNYTVPLLKAQGRTGWGLGIGLNYNSQNWRQDPGGQWKLGRDIGYGHGWKLMAGSIVPFWSGYFNQQFQLFTDATGAEYRLYPVSGSIWRSKEGLFVTYDHATRKLYWPDGSYWEFLAESATTEPDAGWRHVTKMVDTNGNFVAIRYKPGVGFSTPNTSGRIDEIEDVRAVNVGGGVYRTYKFNYDGANHLTSITNDIGTAEGYTFAYSGNITLYSPWSSNYGTTQTLSSLTVSGLNLTTSFQYDSAASLTKTTLPYGGWLRWVYGNFTYTGSRTQPEVQTRYLSKNGSTETMYGIYRDPGDSSRTVHLLAAIWDSSNTGDKVWWFETNGASAYAGLLLTRQDRIYPGWVTKVQNEYTWQQTTNGNPYVYRVLTKLDPGTADEKQKMQEFAVTDGGNVGGSTVYDFGATPVVARLFASSFTEANSNYAYYHVMNRPVTSQVSDGGAYTTLFNNYYDAQASGICASYGSLVTVTGARQYVATGVTYRGNLTHAHNALTNTTACAQYDTTGNSPTQLDALNRTHSSTFTSWPSEQDTNYAVPTSKTMGVYTESMHWNTPFLGLTQDTMVNNSTSSLQYDSYARPSQSTSPTGAVTTYAYTVSPPTVTATTNGRWVKTTLDGLGRTLKVESGYSTTTVSIVDYEYDSYGTSPLGKLKRQSNPYAPGTPPASIKWTTYNYDGIGRTTSRVAPDAASTTAYSYAGNTVIVTDAASKWKKLTFNVFDKITKLTEPNPAGGAWDTTYTYNKFDQLTQIQQTRNGSTQTRTWNFTGAYLTQTIMPETGITNYYFDAQGRPSYKIDAKNQKTTITYDALSRVTQISRYSNASNPTPDPYAGVTITYDSVGGAPNWTSSNTIGRIAQLTYYAGTREIREYINYNNVGDVVAKRFRIMPSTTYWLDANWTFDNEGRMTSVKYPDTLSGPGPTYNLTYDSMGRLNGMSQQAGSTLVNNVTFGPAGEMLTMSFSGYNETRQYNANLQLTRLTASTGSTVATDFEYRFSATQNNGKITQMKDWVTGEEVTYAYDALNRLASAQTTGPEWGQSYTWDGFGNLTGQNVTKGTAPYMAATFDPLTNRKIGGTYDANGNDLAFGSFDIENRLKSAGVTEYGYAPDNKRVWKKVDSNPANDEFYFWAGNQRLGTYKSANPGSAPFSSGDINTYFGGRLIRQSKPITIYNTGVGSGGLAADGATDTHYTLAISPDSGFPGPAAKVVNSSAWPIPPWMSNGPNSKWLAPQANQGTGNAAGDYTYRTTFDLTGSDPATAQLTGQWASDNSGIIKLNGNTVGTASGGFGSWTSFTITSGFIAGVNTLDFVVSNGTPTPNPTAVRVEISGTVGTPVLIDRLGSNVTGGKRYFPFGQEKPSATSNNLEKFTGFYRDAETGLDYADQRYHNPGTGRFLTADPIGSGLNWYSYTAGDPVNFIDPSGLDPSPSDTVDSCGNYQGIVRRDECKPIGYAPGQEYAICWDHPDQIACWPYGPGHPPIPGTPPTFEVITEMLDPLIRAGIISPHWSYDEESWNVAFEFGPAAVGIIIGAGAAGEVAGVWCARNPACVATVGATIYVAFHNLAKLADVFLAKSTSKDFAPVSFERYNPGRDESGNCNPMDPDKFVKWKGTPDLQGDHWHWWDWNQNPRTCEAFPDYKSGPDNPGDKWKEIPRK